MAYTLAFAATSAFASIVISTATAYLSLCGGGVMWRQIGHTYAFAATFAFASTSQKGVIVEAENDVLPWDLLGSVGTLLGVSWGSLGFP